VKIIIWGHHPVHSHTHSYIHEAFYKAFSHLGHDVSWIPNRPNWRIPNDALVITEGQQDSHLQVNPKAFYVIHNCNAEKYLEAKTLRLQVYTNDVRDRAINPIYDRLSSCVYVERASDALTLYQPWATDLMPDEIDFHKANLSRDRVCHWVGTIGGGQFGNEKELAGWQRACKKHGIGFEHHSGISPEQNRLLIQKSYLAPAIVGTWQAEKGYIPCRIFKNVSYGQMPITNSIAVGELFEDFAVCDVNTEQLFEDALCYSTKSIGYAMDFVKKHHTYVNRIQTILDCLR
jgi:hypothetical protein